jgi:hypothetical protein
MRAHAHQHSQMLSASYSQANPALCLANCSKSSPLQWPLKPPTLACSLQAQLAALQDAHAVDIAGIQEAAARQLGSHVKTADAIIRELESNVMTLQAQLTSEVERADGAAHELQR